MKKLLIALLFLINSAQAMNIDTFMDEHIAPFSDAVAKIIFLPINCFGSKVPLIIIWVLFAGIFFTIYFKGVAIWGLKHSIDLIFGKSKKDGESKDGEGEVSSFQALMTALSGTVGLGNIAGVAV